MKKGFTLAEVLLALAIIGVIAAITLPGLKSDVGSRKQNAWYAKYCNILDAAVGQLFADRSLTADNFAANITSANLAPYLQVDTSTDDYIFKDGCTLKTPEAADGSIIITFPPKAHLDDKRYTVVAGLEGLNCSEFQQ